MFERAMFFEVQIVYLIVSFCLKYKKMLKFIRKCFSLFQVVNCSTPANFFHILRRQITLNFRKPVSFFLLLFNIRVKRQLSFIKPYFCKYKNQTRKQTRKWFSPFPCQSTLTLHKGTGDNKRILQQLDQRWPHG